MAKKRIFTQVGKRKLELSNLDKVLYPEDNIVKAEVIQYYLKIAPYMLAYIKNRPLSLVRFPSGIHNETFFQKNKPDWSPDWIEYTRLGSEEKKEYILPTEDATLVWLANLACLELHQIHAYSHHVDTPDYFVFDLDPPESYDFTKLKDIAFNLNQLATSYGYTAFPKLTGGKGIHLLVPIEPSWAYHEVFEAAQKIARSFVDKYSKITTLHIKKEARKGKVLIDIYRNRSSQTIIAPYSLRGRVGAPVSAPITWDELPAIKSSKGITIKNVFDLLEKRGDPWEGMKAYEVRLHTKPNAQLIKDELSESKYYKSPEQLKTYEDKRDFNKSPEPIPKITPGEGNAFVIHRHHASSLHYDLRLEKEGTLKSWAVPKGLPPHPDVKRLAVATEDHPLEYLNFEGAIPKGLYGGGQMWVFSNGRYEITKEKKNGFYFFLKGKNQYGEYRMHQTSQSEWLLERVDKPAYTINSHKLSPMLATITENVPDSDEYYFEVKWDGIRAFIYVEEGDVKIISRNGRDITQQFPELHHVQSDIRSVSAVFDGEIVCLDSDGRPNFKQVIKRLMSSEGNKSLMKKYPAYCYLFDCLYLDGRMLLDDPLYRRRVWLKDSIKSGGNYRFSTNETDGEALFNAVRLNGLEGIVAKKINSKYYPGKRSYEWMKIKVSRSEDFLILGYTPGKGDRANLFGALHLGSVNDGKLIYRGKVGTGYDQERMVQLKQIMSKIKMIEKPIPEDSPEIRQSVWIEQKLVAEIKYSEITENEILRNPVFIKLRPDL